MSTYIGSPITRKEDFRFLTGRATFVDDFKVPGMLHAAVLRSPHAHAKIRSIDPKAALEIPGVVAVLTYDDIAEVAKPIPIRLYPLPGLENFLQYPLAQNVVRHVGDAVALVVAESRYLAEDGMEAIEVDYEILPAVVDMEEALKDRVVVHEAQGTNLAHQYDFLIGDIDSAFARAEYTRKETFKTHRHTGNPLETRGLIASHDSSTGELTVWGPTKVPHFNRHVLCGYLGIPEDAVHFVEPDVGAGFGIRGEFYPEDFLIPFAAVKLGRPVKWIEDRMEHLMSANHSRQVTCEIEVAALRDGTLLGMRALIAGDMGAYIRTHGGLVPASTAALITGPYQVAAYQCTVRCVMTNKTGMGTFRAPGRYESCFIRERMMDLIAQDLGIDPVEIRLKNMIKPSQMPYELGATRADGPITVFDSGDYPSTLHRTLEEIGYADLVSRQGQLIDGRYHGVGIAPFVKNTGQGPYEGARVVVEGPGKIGLYMGITTLGQGHETVMAQVCGDSLGVPMSSVSLFHGNTDYMPRGEGTFASRAVVMGGNAAHMACQQLKAKVLALAGRYLGIDADDLDMKEGQIHRKGSEGEGPLLSLDDVAQRAGEVLEATAYFENDKLTYAYGAHAAHVAVDPETGMLEVLKYVVVEDVGRAINPLLVHGQAVGAAVQGIGATILEELAYDENGQLLAGTFMDYLLPTSRDVPSIDTVTLEEAPSPLNPLGVKGAGEGGIVATAAALANAVSNALGVNVTELPLSPTRVRELARHKLSQ